MQTVARPERKARVDLDPDGKPRLHGRRLDDRAIAAAEIHEPVLRTQTQQPQSHGEDGRIDPPERRIRLRQGPVAAGSPADQMTRRRRRALPYTNLENVPHTSTIRDTDPTEATARAFGSATQRRYNRRPDRERKREESPMSNTSNTVTHAPDQTLTLLPERDSREMCFKQGKACVYQSETDERIIITEWPNGVVKRHNTETKLVTRSWPDGYEETYPEGSPRDRMYPHIPRPDEQEPECQS